MSDLALPEDQNIIVYDFDENDLGEIPEFTKEELNGAVIYVHGVSNRAFEGEYGTPAYSLLWNLYGDADAANPNSWHYGLLLSESSLPIQMTRRMSERGRLPFLAVLVKQDKKGTKGQTYWNLERYVQRFDATGAPVNPNASLLEKRS